MVSPLSPGDFPAEVAPASHCCSSPPPRQVCLPHSLLHYQMQEFPCSSFSLHAFLLASLSLSVPSPWFIFVEGQKPFLSLPGSLLVPPGSVPPPGRFGPLELTKKNREAVPGVVYWPSILSLHNYGFCMWGRNCSASVSWYKAAAMCVMPERQRAEEKENLRTLFILLPNILRYKDQTNCQIVLTWAGFTNHALLEELGENLLSHIMKGANKLFSWRVNIIKKIIFYVIFFSSLLIAAWNTFLKHNELQMNSWAINLLYMALEGKLIRWVDAITAIT